MDIYKRNRLLIWTALILLVANLISLSVIWFEKCDVPPLKTDFKRNKSVVKNDHRGTFLVRELNLDTIQANLYFEERNLHHKRMHQIMDKIQKDRQLLYQEVFANQPDSQAINSIIDSIGYLNGAIEKLNYTHFETIKQILNQKQEEKFKEILNDAPYGRIEMQGRQHRQRNSGSR